MKKEMKMKVMIGRRKTEIRDGGNRTSLDTTPTSTKGSYPLFLCAEMLWLKVWGAAVRSLEGLLYVCKTRLGVVKMLRRVPEYSL